MKMFKEEDDKKGGVSLFDSLLAHGTADDCQLGTILAHGCVTSAEQRKVIARARGAGLEPGLSGYTVLLNQLHVEGRSGEVNETIAEMRAAGIEPDERIKQTLDRPFEMLSRIRTKKLTTMLRADSKNDAMALFDGLLARGQADGYQLAAVVAHGCATSLEQREVIARARKAGLEPGINAFTALLNQLQVEGRASEVDETMSEMHAAGIEPVEDAQQMPRKHQLARVRSEHLWSLLKNGDMSNAMALFDGWLALGQANSFHLGVVLGHGCVTSTEQREVIARAREAGLEPGANAFAALVTQLQVEGRVSEVDETVSEMLAAGIKPNARAREALERSPEDLSRMRTTKLVDILKANRTAGRALFDGWLARGLASSFQLGAVLAHGCVTSFEQREVIARAREAGLEPGINTYNILLTRLQVEGRVSEMDETMSEMHAAGIEPDEHTEGALDRSPEDLSRIRTTNIANMLKNDDKSNAMALFDGLLARGRADGYQLGAVLAHGCVTSPEQRQVIARAREAGLEPNLKAYTVLLHQLHYESRVGEVHETLKEMRAVGMEPDERTRAKLRRSFSPSRKALW